jgi:Uma2 family endonuclease
MATEADVRFALAELPMPLILRPEVPMSEDELLRFCSANKGYQIETEPDGSICINEPKGVFYSQQLGHLNAAFHLWAEEVDRCGVPFINLGIILPDGSMRSPSIAWLSSERYQTIPKSERWRFLRLMPEFVAEIRCRTDTEESLAIRMRRWMDAGAQLAWLIDPQRKLAMNYRPAQEPETCLQPETLEGEGPIAGFSLRIHRFWE